MGVGERGVGVVRNQNKGLSVSAFIRKLVENHRKERRKKKLIAAAQSLVDEYQTNIELTAFTALDGEEVL